MKQYKTYKDSGVEWLGEIPEHWEVKRLKFLGDAIGGVTYAPKDIVENEEEGTLVLRSSNIQKGELYLEDNVYINTEIQEKKILRNGDILICSRNGSRHLIGKNICIDERTEGETFGAFMMIFRSENSKFLYQFFNSPIFKSQSGLFLTATINQLTSGTLNNFYIAIPKSPEEQTQIAKYLNYKIAELDKLIDKKEQLINLLQEERTAMINQAVTKGLDLSVPTKDSGIEWLGEIPAHWEMKKLRYLGTNQNGISEGAEFFGKGFPFISYSDVFKNRVLPINVSGLANSNEKHWSNYSVEKGDVFFTRTSETIEDIGMSSVCKKTINKATFAGFLIRFRPHKGKLDIDFSRYYFSCFIPRVFFVKEMNLVTRASLSQDLLKRLPVLIPSIKEQFKIAQYLNKKTEEIDFTLNNISKQIKQLKEYKTALISEVVTGKIDVREEVLN
ncbi:restriction endonuclease subunit S [Tenacibaculum maritimum]|uniref:restriction endonuclease subunit S n=1 Tax=Tenacibaculum maritimum TaxID=107401 RepID=UPI0012E5DBCC|nr:restriction endonuclease subunit S [Tenacibaculum maritimum]MCD9581251.1 restriction endonuclease subunit S [Tenacibaculum maritimum]MCD9635228.1 restriction endonuclease subunit S [Tenacibaculum maritimum]CAA0260856.1 Restriction endonuclease subunit S [Tenacibaculum maritimum]